MSNEGVIYRISGPVVTATGMSAAMYDVVRVGHEGLMGEVIELHGEKAVIQVYEDTSGIRPGEPVLNTEETLSVSLGPGLLTQIYDGIQRPLPTLEKEMGVFITRGVDADAFDLEKIWTFEPQVAVGDEVVGGQVIGHVQETDTIIHKITFLLLFAAHHTKHVVAVVYTTISLGQRQRICFRVPQAVIQQHRLDFAKLAAIALDYRVKTQVIMAVLHSRAVGNGNIFV